MRNKIIGLILGLMPVLLALGCDPHEDVYVPGEIKHECFNVAQGVLKVYRSCLVANGCKIEPDPMPLSETPVFICNED